MTKNNDDDIANLARELQERMREELRRTYSPAVIDH